MTQPLRAAEAASVPAAGPLAAYVAFWQDFSPDALDRLDGLIAEDIRFSDPFNDVTGAAAFKRMLAGMMKHIVDPRFTVTHWAQAGDVAYLSWRFDFTTYLKRKAWVIEGVSELRLGPDGRIAEHRDHWDSGRQFYRKLPGIGLMIALVRRKLRQG